MMALGGPEAPRGFAGAVHTARTVILHDGVLGLYKGFGTVIAGMIPARMLYLGALESSKAATASILHPFNLSDTLESGASSFIGGGMASLSSQLVNVPIDVVSQRQMIHGGGLKTTQLRQNGIQLAKEIIHREGVLGLYRGFGASIITFVPSSAIWWSAYSGFQVFLYHQVDRINNYERSAVDVVAVQASSGILTGIVTGLLTTPLDVIKTRLQTVEKGKTWRQVAGHLYEKEGIYGFMRGAPPRIMNMCIWGTAMVSTYEFLKRLCRKEGVQPSQQTT